LAIVGVLAAPATRRFLFEGHDTHRAIASGGTIVVRVLRPSVNPTIALALLSQLNMFRGLLK
jgi:hypothetical protein